MDKDLRPYLPPSVKVSRVELESTICGGSVFNADGKQAIDIEEQQYNENWNTAGDFSNTADWTPKSTTNP